MTAEIGSEMARPTPAHPHDEKPDSPKRVSVGAKGRRSRAKKPKVAARRSGSKQDRVITLLSRKPGATVAVIMRATGWQKHSVHGFLAGVVKKKLGFTLFSEKTDGDRVYRIESRKPGRRAASKTSSRRRAG